MKLIPVRHFIIHSKLTENAIANKLETHIEQDAKILLALRSEKKYAGKIIFPYFLIRRIIGLRRYENLTFAQGRIKEGVSGSIIYLKIQVDIISRLITVISLLISGLSFLTVLTSYLLSVLQLSLRYEIAILWYVGVFFCFIYLVSFTHFYIEAMTLKVFLTELFETEDIEEINLSNVKKFNNSIWTKKSEN